MLVSKISSIIRIIGGSRCSTNAGHVADLPKNKQIEFKSLESMVATIFKI